MSPAKQMNLREAAANYDRKAIATVREKAENDRLELVKRFPIAGWPSMSVEDYALGHKNSENSFCRWMEFRTANIASIRGGSAMKHMLFKRKGKEGWFFDKSFKNKDDAWEALRAGFVEALGYAKSGQWDEIDGIQSLNGGPALRMKTIYIYYPDDVLPVCSTAHIRHFLQKVDPDFVDSAGGVVRLNRMLRSKLKAIPEFSSWTTWEMAAFLYSWSHPRNVKHVVKIAPGEKAMYWDECLANGYVCVGWDDVGDLNDFQSKEELHAKFTEQFDYTPAKATTKVNELWTLRELEPGDLVVANKGVSHVLAIGEVQEPGYEYRNERKQFRHTLAVKWDTSVSKDIPPQKNWAFTTVSKVPASLYELIMKSDSNRPIQPPVPSVADSLFLDLENALTLRGQVLMYGPPGTGKTHYARRMALWWLLRDSGVSESEILEVLESNSRFLTEENALTRARTSNKTWYVVANPQVWNWSQLKKEKKVTFHYGRLQRNYPVLQPGDLVVGYLSGTAKVIAAIAKVTKGLSTDSKGEQFIELEYVADVTNGLTYEELLADPILANSEPLRFRNQGTLFALTEAESDHLWGLLLERDPSIEAHLGSEDGIGQLTRVTFHPSYSYEDFIEGFRPVKNSSGDGLRLTLEDGLFKRVCRQAQLKPDKKFVVIIDELNRANVAKVFGELITLIEYDKRGLEVTLSPE